MILRPAVVSQVAKPCMPRSQGIHKGAVALLWGEPAHDACRRLWLAAQRAAGVGGTRPPRLAPGGGNGKGGVQTSLPPAVRGCVAPMAGSPLVECVLAVLPLFSPLRSATYRSISRSAFQKSCQRHPPLPCFYPHSEWAVRGPVQVGVRSKAQVHHTVTDLGCWGAAIYSAISGGSARFTQSPEQGGGCLCLPNF